MTGQIDTRLPHLVLSLNHLTCISKNIPSFQQTPSIMVIPLKRQILLLRPHKPNLRNQNPRIYSSHTPPPHTLHPQIFIEIERLRQRHVPQLRRVYSSPSPPTRTLHNNVVAAIERVIEAFFSSKAHQRLEFRQVYSVTSTPLSHFAESTSNPCSCRT